MYCNILRPLEAAFFELEKTMFAGATRVPMFTIVTPGPYTHSEQSKATNAKCNLKVNYEKIGWITKKDCMSVTDLNQTFR